MYTRVKYVFLVVTVLTNLSDDLGFSTIKKVFFFLNFRHNALDVENALTKLEKRIDSSQRVIT